MSRRKEAGWERAVTITAAIVIAGILLVALFL